VHVHVKSFLVVYCFSVNYNMSMIRQYAYLSLFLSFFILFSFLYSGIITPPLLGDSHDYHMPIAENFLHGTFFQIPKTANPFINFPGSSELILAFFILLHIPVNWFCVLGWVLLFLLMRKMGLLFNLGSELSLIYATAFTSTLSVFRQMNTQSIDMWMAVWFVLLVILLEKPRKTIGYFLLLGFAFGMLVGSKFTGPVFMIILLLVYGIRLIKLLNLSNILAFLIPFFIFGASWYIRNFITWGDPIYPLSFFIFHGLQVDITNYILWQEVLRGHGLSILTALISEYLIWGLSFIPFLVLFIVNLKAKFINSNTSRIFWLCLLLFVASFFMYSFKSTKFDFVVSNMRYMFPVIIMLMLSLFIMAKRFKLTQEIALLALINSITAVSFIIYHPKLIILYLIISSILYITGKTYIKQFIYKAS
jgi:hypothetical protein